ncbi:MAG: alkaline phosphatase family protein [Pseudomonadota bacterium]
MRSLIAPAAYAIIGVVLAAALARTGGRLNLTAPVVAPIATPPPTPHAPRHARTLLVVIDGLRADVADTLPFINEVARRGNRTRLLADPPTYSTAQYVALLAGVPPRDSGVRTNETIRPAGVDDVALRARAGGLVTAVVSTCVDWWRLLFPASFTHALVVPAENILAAFGDIAPGADFVIVHLCAVDDAGHAAGARSPLYSEAARAVDRTTAALARAWGWPGRNVVVTADHGHRDRGGHGGAEPEVRTSFLVAAGPDIQETTDAGVARVVDMAPTLASLLGVAAPVTASGRTLVELLSLPARERAAAVTDDVARGARVANATAAARGPLERGQRRARLLRGIPALLAAAGVAWLARRRPLAFLRGLVGLALAVAAFTVIFGPVSFSAARRGIVWGLGITALAFVAAAIALILGARRRAGQTKDPLGTAAIVAGFSPPAVAAFVHSGLFASRLSCEPAWVAAGPPFAFAALAGACAAATLIAAAQAAWPWRGSRSEARGH